MSEKQHNLNEILQSAMSNLKSLADVNTVVGEPIKIDENTTIIPVSKVTLGFGVGGSDIPSTTPAQNFGGGSGAGVSVIPLGFIVISNGSVQLLQLSQSNNVAERLVNMLPGAIDKVSSIVNEYRASKGDAKPDAEMAQENMPNE